MFHDIHHGYEHLDQEDLMESGGDTMLNTQYNYVPQNGNLFPGSGLNYVIGLDGHKSLVSQKKLSKPSTFMGTLFCPCFTAEEPLSDESKSRFRACLVSFTFLICLGEFIMLCFLMKDGFAPANENPSLGPSYATLMHYGAKAFPKMVLEKEIWRFFSSIFLYAGFLHALCNMIIQFRLGMYLEREWGYAWYLLTYLLSGVGGAMVSCILQPHEIGVGATAPIAGMVGAYGVQIALCYRLFDSFQRKLQGCQFFVFFMMMLIIMLCPFVNWSNVAGGFLVGMMMGGLIWAAEEKHKAWIIFILLLIGGFTAGFCYLFLVVSNVL